MTVAHAGEEGPPEYIRQALDSLQVARIDHGVRCIEDATLVERLVRNQVPLTVCPISNVKLRIFETMQAHNLKRLLDLGIRITINSDDPAYFGGYITENFLQAQRALMLDVGDIYRLSKNAILASFLGHSDKEKLLQELDTYIL
jgi:adenosine deaminase